MNSPSSSNKPGQLHPGVGAAQSGGDRPALGDLRRSVAEVTRILYVRRWLFFTPLCLVMTAAFSLSLHVPRRYVCSTTFERRDDSVLVNLPSNEGTAAFITFRRTLEQDISNPDSLIDVARRLRLVQRRDEKLRDEDREKLGAVEGRLRPAAARIGRGLDVRFLQASEHLDVIEILYTSDDPEIMTEVLNEVRDHYIATTQRRINDVLQDTKAWFETERQKRLTVVEALEDDLIEFRTEHQGIDPLNPGAASAKLAEGRVNLLELQRKSKELDTQVEGRRSFLRGAAASTPTNLIPEFGIGAVRRSPETLKLLAAIDRLQSEIDGLRHTNGMTELHPRIVAMERQRDELTAEAERQSSLDAIAISVNGVTEVYPPAISGPGAVPRPGRTRADMELGIFEKLQADNAAEVRAAKVVIAEREAIQHDAFVRRKEFSSRLAEVDRARGELTLYQGYADQIGRVLTAENSQRGILFGKIKPATGGGVPASPRLSTVIVLALSISLTTSVVLVLLSELFDRTIRTRRQITETLGLPILESIGEIVSSAARRRRMISSMIIFPATAAMLAAVVVLTGSMAYLSLQKRTMYDRMMTVPRSMLSRVVDESGNTENGKSKTADMSTIGTQLSTSTEPGEHQG